MAGALIGIAGAIGALGGVGINVVLRASYLSPANSATMAFWVFLGFYVLCAAITWFAYVRTPTKVAGQAGGRQAAEAGHDVTRTEVRRGRRPRHGGAPVRRGDARPRPDGRWQVIVLCEEPTPGLRPGGAVLVRRRWDRAALALPGNDYAADDFVELRIGVRATAIDRDARVVTTSTGDDDRLRRAGARHRFVPVRAADPRQGPRPLLRLPHAGRPRRDPRGGRTERHRRRSSSAVDCWAWRPPTRCGCWA